MFMVGVRLLRVCKEIRAGVGTRGPSRQSSDEEEEGSH